MNIKRITVILVVFSLILSTLSVASAGMFDFLGSNNNNTTDNGKTVTFLTVSKAQDSAQNTFFAIVTLYQNTANASEYLQNMSIEVNITDSNGDTQPYNLTTDGHGMSIIKDMHWNR